MLSSPLLWGRLLDLDALSIGRQEWHHEVLRRTGQAPLSIRSEEATRRSISLTPQRILPPSENKSHKVPSTMEFFFTLLDNEWHRIERLSVRIGPYVTIPPEILSSPAPQLKVFEVYSISELDVPADLTLFDDRAPLLRVFRSRDLMFKHSASWLQNLRILEIGAQFRIPFVLDILKNTPKLEKLIYSGPYDEVIPEGTPPAPVFTLNPNLQHLTIGTSVEACLYLISSIVPCHDYGLNISGSRLIPTISFHGLSVYTERHFQFHIPTEVTLDLWNTFHFTSRNADASYFTVIISCSRRSRDQLRILSALQLPTLTLVTTLHLAVPDYLQEEATSQVVEFLHLLPNLKVLDIKDSVCPYLVAIQQQTSDILLPSLDILQVDILSENALDFLRLRRELGCPIAVLDLRKSAEAGVLKVSLENLQRLTGLQVLWD